MAYPSWPEIHTTCMTTRAGVECTASTTYSGVKLSSTITEEDEDIARTRAIRQLRTKVRQRRAYE